MRRFGRASRRMDFVGVALMTVMMLMLWVQHSALAAGSAQSAPDAVGAEVGDGGTTGTTASAGAEHL